jgi:hypothetical protein
MSRLNEYEHAVIETIRASARPITAAVVFSNRGDVLVNHTEAAVQAICHKLRDAGEIRGGRQRYAEGARKVAVFYLTDGQAAAEPAMEEYVKRTKIKATGYTRRGPVPTEPMLTLPYGEGINPLQLTFPQGRALLAALKGIFEPQS